MVLIWISAKMVTTTVTGNMASMANMATERNTDMVTVMGIVNNYNILNAWLLAYFSLRSITNKIQFLFKHVTFFVAYSIIV